MDCPSCHSQNADAASACSACGASLRSASSSANSHAPRKSARRPGSRRRPPPDEGPAYGDTPQPAVRRAYHLSLWAFVPVAGLVLGPVAILLGWLALRGTGEDFRASNRARAAILFGALNAVTQWLGLYLMVGGWPP